jgi:hypothetical protein
MVQGRLIILWTLGTRAFHRTSEIAGVWIDQRPGATATKDLGCTVDVGV